MRERKNTGVECAGCGHKCATTQTSREFPVRLCIDCQHYERNKFQLRLDFQAGRR